jgi:hypothetical protein
LVPLLLLLMLWLRPGRHSSTQQGLLVLGCNGLRSLAFVTAPPLLLLLLLPAAQPGKQLYLGGSTSNTNATQIATQAVC